MPALSRQGFSAIWTILIPPSLSSLRAALEMNQWNLPLCQTSRFLLLTFPHSHFTQTPPCPEHPPHCSVCQLSSPGCQALCKPSPKKQSLPQRASEPQRSAGHHQFSSFSCCFYLVLLSLEHCLPLCQLEPSLSPLLDSFISIFFSLDATNFSCLVCSPFDPTSAFFGIAIPAPWRSGRKGVK